MNIENLIAKLETVRSRPDVSLATDRRIKDALDYISEDLDYLDSDYGFEEHVEEFLKEEQGGDVCDCLYPMCAPKHGNLPVQIRDVDDIDRALSDYRMEHGNPVWISECRSAWKQRKKRVKRVLEEAILAAKHDDITELNSVIEDE